MTPEPSRPPRRARFLAANLLWALAGMGACEAPPADSDPAPEVRTWRLVRHSAAEPALNEIPGAWTEGSELVDRCRRRAAEGRDPCIVERWRDPGGDLRFLVRTAQRAWLAGPEGGSPAMSSWRPLSGTLSRCLGDPWFLPPAGDPKGFRLLQEAGEERRWLLILRGENPCGLHGTLQLDVHRPQVALEALEVKGDPWKKGGRERAGAVLRTALRAEAESRWPDLPADERILLVRSLERDPAPEAAAILRRLAREDPAWAADIERALQRREENLQAAPRSSSTSSPSTGEDPVAPQPH